jgi:hypothetical protein
MDQKTRKYYAKVLRVFRKIHRITGAGLFIFFVVVAITSVLLGWKKHSNGIIQSKNFKGTSSNLQDWKSLDSLKIYAINTLQDSISMDISKEIDRVEIREKDGILKFFFKNHYWAIQTDGVTGKALHVEYRISDLIEDLHDGSIFDKWFKTDTEVFRLIYSSVLGMALLLFSVTGFWLWYGPKIRRKNT